MKWLVVAGSVCLLSMGGIGSAVAQPPPPGYAQIPPPRHEDVPPPPHGRRMVWEPGHWHWDGVHYEWVRGHYIERRDGRWIEGRWVWGPREGRWVWRPAHWE